GRTIRIPVHMVEKLNKVVHVERRLVQELGRGPTPEEIAQQLECTPREVRDILRIAQQPVSLEKPIGEEEESELGDFVEDQTAESPFEQASENLRRENVRRALAALPAREREVIELRFGLTGGRPRTLEAVGRAFKGTLEFKLGDEVLELGPLTAVRVAPEVVRSVWNDGPDDAELIICSVKGADIESEVDLIDDFWLTG